MPAVTSTTKSPVPIRQLKAAASVLSIKARLQGAAVYCLSWVAVLAVLAASPLVAPVQRTVYAAAAVALALESVWVLQTALPLALLAQSVTLLVVGLWNLGYILPRIAATAAWQHNLNLVQNLVAAGAQITSAVFLYRSYPAYRSAMQDTDFFTIGILQSIRDTLLRHGSLSLPDVLQLSRNGQQLLIALRPGYAVMVRRRTRRISVAATEELAVIANGSGSDSQSVTLTLPEGPPEVWRLSAGSFSEYERWKREGADYQCSPTGTSAGLALAVRHLKRKLAVAAVVIIVLGAAAALFASGAWIPLHPAYRQMVSAVVHNPAITGQLGQDVEARWGARGTVRASHGAGYASLRLPLHGTRGDATAYVVAVFEAGVWQISDLALQRGTQIQYLDSPVQQRLQWPLPAAGKVYLLPLGEPDAVSLTNAAQRLQEIYPVQVRILPSEPVPSSLEDPVRHQLIAEEVVDWMRRSHRSLADDFSATLIAVTNKDLFIRSYRWNFAFGWHDGRFGVLSGNRLGRYAPWDPDNPLLIHVRLRKLLTRYVLIAGFQISPSADPYSSVYGGIGDAADIDRMTPRLTGLGPAWNPLPDSARPCLTVVVADANPAQWRLDCSHGAPLLEAQESYSTGLNWGGFVLGHTDFYLDGAYPVALQRMYRPRDDRSRAFGVGASHSLDVFLVGDSQQFSYIDLILEDGARVRFLRTSQGSGYADTVFRSGASTLKWNGHGWDMERADGWTYVFPSCGPKSTPQQCALIGMHDSAGHAIRIERDPQGNLLRVANPEGRRLQFRYDAGWRIIHAEDNAGHSFDYTYDEQGRMLRADSNSGYGERYTYDSENRMLQVWRGQRLALTNTYDKNTGRLTGQEFDNRNFRYHYDMFNEHLDMADVTTPDGFTTHFYFNAPGGPTSLCPCARALTNSLVTFCPEEEAGRARVS